MGSVTSEEGSDKQSERYGSYSLSADVSESESSSGFSYRSFDHEGASSSLNSSPLAYMSNFCFATPRPPPPLILPMFGAKDTKNEKPCQRDTELSEVEMMKERFAKLLLGEDMSGGGKGVCTALAISNAITNLSATVFGELWRLEPLTPQKKSMWCREMEWLLSVSDSIVEFVPSVQRFPGGGTFFEVMATRPRSDLYINLPALKKLDAMLLGILDGFRDTEFWYVDRGIILGDAEDSDSYSSSRSGGGRPSFRQEDKWWLPYPKVPPSGLSVGARKKLQQCKDCTNQILKAAMAINTSILAEMNIPNAYLETLPKNGKLCVGNSIYGYLTGNKFNPESVLDCLDFSTEHRSLEIVNSIEASIHVWRRKSQKKLTNHANEKRSSWGGKVKGVVSDNGKNHVLAKRADNLLRCLRQHYPGLSQSALDMSKIQYNKDVGQAILESYSRVMESLAFNVMARIDDLLYVDDANKHAEKSVSCFNKNGLPIQKRISPSPFSIHSSPFSTPGRGVLSDQNSKPPIRMEKSWSGARKVH